MARGPRKKIEINENAIIAYFDEAAQRVYTAAELEGVLSDLREVVGTSLNREQIISQLSKRTHLRTVSITRSTKPKRPFSRYMWREASPYEVGLSLEHGYLSHGSAMALNGLTDTPSRTIYVNREQSKKPPPDRDSITQAGINRAFKSKQRSTNYICSWENWQFAILSGKHSGRLEVGTKIVNGVRLPVTKLERTLIDIAVRPAYSGGVSQVLEAYRRARKRASVDTLLRTLAALDYAYPYHQAIGFYLERAGYASDEYEQFRALGLELDFYVAHNLRETEFVKSWRLHVPKGL